MSIELTMAAWALVLAFVQIILADVARTGQYGLQWNMSARDGDMPPLKPVVSRLLRAQANLFETLPLFLGFVLIGALAERTNALSALGAQIYLAARLAYVPLYAFGVPVLRSLSWIVSVAGIGMIAWAVLAPEFGG